VMIGGLKHSTFVNWKMKHNLLVFIKIMQVRSCRSTNTQSVHHSVQDHSTRQCACITPVQPKPGIVNSTNACAPCVKWGRHVKYRNTPEKHSTASHKNCLRGLRILLSSWMRSIKLREKLKITSRIIQNLGSIKNIMRIKRELLMIG